MEYKSKTGKFNFNFQNICCQSTNADTRGSCDLSCHLTSIYIVAIDAP